MISKIQFLSFNNPDHYFYPEAILNSILGSFEGTKIINTVGNIFNFLPDVVVEQAYQKIQNCCDYNNQVSQVYLYITE